MMSSWFTYTDEIGPEKILYVYDPEVGMKGIIVVDTWSLGGAGGGTRMLPDITTEEMFGLARAMTYKFAMLDLPVGGSKSGIWADPSLPPEKKEAILMAYGRALKPLLEAGVTVGPDMGTDSRDVDTICRGAGVESRISGLSLQEKDGEPMENHATGYGVVVAAQAACEFAGIDIKGATVALEGFGKAGGGVARYIAEAGAKLVAVSTVDGAIYNKDGLDVKKLLTDRKSMGDRAVTDYPDAKKIKTAELFSLPVDVLVPGARPYVINEKNAEKIGAKVISSIANNPITNGAHEILFKRKIHVVPDFVSNAGGVLVAVVDVLGGTVDDLFKALREVIPPNVKETLTGAREEKIPPMMLAIKQIREKIIKQRRREIEPPSFEELITMLKERLKI
jgi:glutamate dehydrogenase (NAD(P)+)